MESVYKPRLNPPNSSEISILIRGKVDLARHLCSSHGNLSVPVWGDTLSDLTKGPSTLGPMDRIPTLVYRVWWKRETQRAFWRWRLWFSCQGFVFIPINFFFFNAEGKLLSPSLWQTPLDQLLQTVLLKLHLVWGFKSWLNLLLAAFVFNYRQVLFHPLWDCFRYVFNISLVHDVFLHATVVNQNFMSCPVA